ncbi:MAG: 50S ribosomal protein L11 methyltransferase [Clostridiaceae bacterium]
MNGEWNEIRIVVPLEAIEAVTGILYGMNVKGISLEDPTDLLTREAGPLSWDFADINLFPEGESAAVLTAYFPDTDNMEEHISFLRERILGLKEFGINSEPFRVEGKKVFEEDWANSWKKYYKPMRIGSRIVIKPTWEDFNADPEDLVVEMDPGMAFGTGTHETTKLCIEILQDYIQGGETVFDVGTGSGILAITAAKLGAKEVLAIDLDPVAVDSANINVRLNQMDQVTVKEGNLLDETGDKADVVIANIIADVIIFLAKDLDRVLKPGGLFIGSGIIHLREQEVLDQLNASGFEVLEVRNENDWRAVVARLKAAE